MQSPHLPPVATEPHDAVAHPRVPHAPSRDPCRPAAVASPCTLDAVAPWRIRTLPRNPSLTCYLSRSLLSRPRAHRCRRPPLTVPSSGASPRRSKPTGSSASSFSSSRRKESRRGRLNRRRHLFLLRHREPQVAHPHVADSPSPPSPTMASFSG